MATEYNIRKLSRPFSEADTIPDQPDTRAGTEVIFRIKSELRPVELAEIRRPVGPVEPNPRN